MRREKGEGKREKLGRWMGIFVFGWRVYIWGGEKEREREISEWIYYDRKGVSEVKVN